MNHGYSDTRRDVSPHNDSMTDISVSLLSEDDKPWKQADIEDGGGCATRRSRCAKKCEAFRRWRWVFDTALMLVVVGLLVERRYLQSPARDKRLEPVGDLTGFAPEYFVPDDPKSLFTNASLQENWLKMVPRGLGYLEVKNPRAHSNLPVPLPEFAPRTVFTTSMTHQLHCLYAILESYAGLSVNGSAAVDMHSHIPEGTEGADGPWHLQHCFEYLRQAILCSGDVALEGTQTTFPPGFTGSDGWDAKHVCKDPKQVYEYLDKNRALDDHWI
ncbi:unnamed protein product [Colletotrichum noveboracense]|uniref:Oxidase ustYa n=1 Tax=Colletotrichum noveboracense TaxID=2664923 RepID=A0A9W4WLR6_9PEZI|nr:hypothetical protein COL940_003253 [Colletotrichum noveboracense]KAJ0292565.1 hypothetical protein CBS470a_002665 [Colletotrichum nupharicola]CAI0653415.1 unnamed protein product [Colletotrichum noveboracense]